MRTIAQPWMWGAFLAFVVAMLAVDILACGGNKARKMSAKQAAYWSLAWVILALLFSLGMWRYLTEVSGTAIAQQKTMEFLTGYVIEKSLSIDNIFMFLLIFRHFSVPADYQRKVLLYGVLGAIVMRIIMILAGVLIVEKFDWVLYVFGAFLIFTGIKMLMLSDEEPDLNANFIVRYSKKILPFTESYKGERFSVIENGKRFFTPLLLVLILIEATDVVFAIDSIPAIFAITTDPFIVFTSNIFAIMGLRALYFLLADMAERFHFLKYGLALVLMFVGGKMLIADWWHVPTWLSLSVIGAVVLGSIIVSLLATKTVNLEKYE
ncbi:MAG: TerC family protein [Solimicrobium sp.]|jgi:tellurite resistance protein TerC|nr:TerC family protein [Solimicrobium sp.]